MSGLAGHTRWAVPQCAWGLPPGGAAAVQLLRLMDLRFKPPFPASPPPSHLHRRLPRAHGQALFHEGLR